MSEQKLPMAGNAPPAPVVVSASSMRLIATLSVFGAIAGAAIVLAFAWTKPRIEANQAARLTAAITEVLGGAEGYKTVFLEDGRLTLEPQADTARMDRVYVGYDAAGQPRGVAMATQAPGFVDVIRLIFGYDPATGDLMGMKVLDNKETPGLGDKIEKDTLFTRQFIELGTPILGVKKGRATGADEEVIMITGATISSRIVIDMINRRLEALKEPVSTYWSTSLTARGDSTKAPDQPQRAGGGG